MILAAKPDLAEIEQCRESKRTFRNGIFFNVLAERDEDPNIGLWFCALGKISKLVFSMPGQVD